MTAGDERHARNAEARRRASADLRICPADQELCNSGLCPGACVSQEIEAEVAPILSQLGEHEL